MVTETHPASASDDFKPHTLLDLIAARPLVVVAAGLAIGIALGDNEPWIWTALIVGSLVATISVIVRREPTWQLITAGSLAIFAGGLRLAISLPVAGDDVAHFVGRGYVRVLGTVCSDVDVRGDSYVFDLQVESLTLSDGTSPAASGRVRARLRQGSAELRYGDSVEVRGALQRPTPATNPGAFDCSAYLARKGVYCTISARRAANWNRIDRPASTLAFWPRLAESCKRSLQSSLGRILSPVDAGLATGVILGGKGDLPGGVVDDFISTGTVHVLSASGMNVAMTAGLLWYLGRLIHLRRRAASLLVVLGLSFYVLMSGAAPSIMRAYIMALAFLFAPVVDREPDMPCAIAAAALLLLAWDPGNLFDTGFQLSFAAVIAILALMPIGDWFVKRLPAIERFEPSLNRAINWTVRGIAATMMVSVAAQIGTLPLLARYYNQLSLSAIPANALMFWAIGLIMAAGFVAWPLALAMAPAARLFALCCLVPLLKFMVGTAGWFASMTGLSWSVPSPGFFTVVLYYAGLTAIVVRVRSNLDQRSWEPAT